MARKRHGAVQCPLHRGWMGPVARRGRGGGGPAGHWLAGGGRNAGMARRQSDLGRPGERHSLSDRGPGARPARRVRPQPGAPDPSPRRRHRRRAGDRAAQRLGGRRVDPQGDAVVCAGDSIRERASHGGHEQLFACSGRGDPARHRDLPRQVQRLERHWLQLPRRPLRHRVRGSLRRHRPQRRRRVRPGLQHRLYRCCRDRHVRHGSDPRGCRDGTREAARLAARSRPRRSRLHPHLRLGRQRTVSSGCAGRSARGLRSSRHRADNVPWRPSLRRARRRSRRRHRRSGYQSSTSPR